MKTYVRKTALASIAILFLLAGTAPAYADKPQSLDLTVANGTVTQLGSQTYNVQGGTAFLAFVDNFPATGTLEYTLNALQNGPTLTGQGSIDFTGTNLLGQAFSVTGTFTLNDETPAAVIGTGVIPFFMASDNPNIQVSVGGSTPQPLGQPFAVENPYFNPFGNPLILTSADCTIAALNSCSLLIVASYTEGTIFWSGTQVSGAVSGTLGSTPVTGTLTDTTQEFEDLVNGRAFDAGATAFTGMSLPQLDAKGTYFGGSTIPTSGQTTTPVDCSILTGIPNTCTLTGFLSTGRFFAFGQTDKIKATQSGSYITVWPTPSLLSPAALTFTSAIHATVQQTGNHGGHGHGWWDLWGLFG